MQKKKFAFVDKSGGLVKAEVEIRTETGNFMTVDLVPVTEKKTFSMCGEYRGGMGQCFDHIDPATPAQKRLVELWNQWHLNDMNSGTLAQQAALKAVGGSTDYNAQKKYLCEQNLYEVDTIERCMTKFGLRAATYTLSDNSTMDVWEHPTDNWFIQPIRVCPQTAFLSADKEMHKWGSTYYHVNSRFLSREESARRVAEHGMKVGVRDVEDEHNVDPHVLMEGAENDLYFHRYGTNWLHNQLPDNFESELETLIATILSGERSRKLAVKEKWADLPDLPSWKAMEEQLPEETLEKINEAIDGNDWERSLALGFALDLSLPEIIEDVKEEYRNTYSHCGDTYQVLTDDEADEACKESLGDDCYWKEAVQADKTELGKDEWIEMVMNNDGRGSILNHYDGEEM
jgi:hypothetical protein